MKSILISIVFSSRLNPSKPKLFRILSLDGGGVRGIATSAILEKLEEEAKKPITELFDLIVGSSTGALLAGLLTLPKHKNSTQPRFTAKEATQMYFDLADKIFTKEKSWSNTFSLSSWLIQKYTNKDKREAFSKIVQDLKLSDLTNKVMIPSYDLTSNTPYIFMSYEAIKNKTLDYSLVDVLDATTSAPLYFDPVKVLAKDSPFGYRTLIDGGLVANSPSLLALLQYIQKTKKGLNNVALVTVGTGRQIANPTYEEVKGWRADHWILNVIRVLFKTNNDITHYISDVFLNAGLFKNYYRLKLNFDLENSEMDNKNKKNLEWLKKEGELTAWKYLEDIRKMVKLLI